LAIRTVLGSDDSPPDKLVIDGGTGTGSTRVDFSFTGGGALTTGDGILIVEAIGGGTTAPRAFTGPGRVSTARFDYPVTRGGLGRSGPDSWFLRSTYRGELSLDAAAVPVAELYGQSLFDTLHERVGDEERLRLRDDLRDRRWANGGWGRAIVRR